MSERTPFAARLTVLHVLVMHELDGLERSGSDLRTRLHHLGVTHSKAAFYQLAMRMEGEGLITSTRHPGRVKRTSYKLTHRGLSTLKGVRERITPPHAKGNRKA